MTTEELPKKPYPKGKEIEMKLKTSGPHEVFGSWSFEAEGKSKFIDECFSKVLDFVYPKNNSIITLKRDAKGRFLKP